MPLPLKLILIPALKIVLLGMLKTIFILIGALVLPVLTLRLLLSSAITIIRPVSSWHRKSTQIDAPVLDELESHLVTLQSQKLTRTESREILMGMVRDTIAAIKSSLRDLASSWGAWFMRLITIIKSRRTD